MPWIFKYSNAEGFYISVLRLDDLWAELDSVERKLAGIANEVLGPFHEPEDEDRAPRPMPIPFPLMGYPPPATAPPAGS